MNREYFEALEAVLQGDDICPRGLKCREILGYEFLLANPKERVSTYETMKTNINYADLELRWYMSGTDRIDFDPLIQKIWSQYSDDGVSVNSAYGHRIFGSLTRMNGLNQWNWAKAKMIEDPDTRQAIININSFWDKEKPTKDFPCCIDIHCFNRQGVLHWITHWRSHDIFRGIRNDIYTMTAMQELMARQMNLKLGTFTMFSDSLHIYEEDINKAEQVLEGEPLENIIHEVDLTRWL